MSPPNSPAMPNKSEIQIFLAHANEDKEQVLQLYDRLKEAGYKPWLDKKDLLPGMNWRAEIPNVIKKSQLFIACLSQKSIAKAGYVQKEFKLALSRYAEMPSQKIFLIPLRLNECEIPDLGQEEYGINLRDLHWLDYWEEDGFKQLEKAIAYQYGPFSDPVLKTSEPSVIVTPSPPRLQVFKFEIVTVNARGEQINQESRQAQYFRQDLGGGVSLDMVYVPGGKFWMGSPAGEGDDSEKPQHEVTVQPFFMGKYPVTQAQWGAIASRRDLQVERELKPNPAFFQDDKRPVEQVSWYDAVEFSARLAKLTGREYRLPSEAEWEYACRSVISYQLSVTSEELTDSEWNEKYDQPFYFGETITTDLVNFNGNYTYASAPKGIYRKETTPVGQFRPNAFGLYDMHGNIWEWCEDTWHNNYAGAPTDGSAWLKDGNESRSPLRGGSFDSTPYICRSAYRDFIWRVYDSQDIGFRVVCVSGRTL